MKSGCLTAHYSKSMNSTLDEPVVIENRGGQLVATASGVEARAVALRGRAEGAELEWSEPGEPAFSLRTGSGGSSKPMVAVMFHENQRAELTISETAGALKTGGGKPGQGYPALLDGIGVRRLTPLECERLQGFPDRWTAEGVDGKPISDSQRYRQLGNAVAVPVVEWIARRLVEVDRLHS